MHRLGILAWLVATCWSAPAFSNEALPGEDALALVGRLIADGHWGRAHTVFDAVDPTEIDPAQHALLQGLLASEAKDVQGAIQSFERAIELDHPDPLVHLYLIEAVLTADQAERGVALLQDAPLLLEELASYWLLRARAFRANGEPSPALQALEEGAQRFPERNDFAIRQVLLLTENKLMAEAHTRAMTLVGRLSVDEVVTIAATFADNDDVQGAVSLLETLALFHPDDAAVLVPLAHAHLKQDRPTTAAKLLERAAVTDPSVYTEAAECHRRAGNLLRALEANSHVPDAAEKARQRLGLLIERMDFIGATSLAPRLQRLGLLEDDTIRYALAYAWFREGEYDRSEALLGNIEDSQMFRQATELRQAMEQCRSEPWDCV